MGNFNKSLPFIFKAEGGYSNRKGDEGGETNFGVTHTTFDAAKQLGLIDNSIASVKDITREDAAIIYKKMYWDPIHGDDLPQDLATAVFDMAVNSGTTTAAKTLQEILGVTQDGVIGPETLNAINNYEGNLINDYLNAREKFYRELVKRKPKQLENLNGWLNRLNRLRSNLCSDNKSSKDNSRAPFTTAKNSNVRYDPLMVDLNGDGIKTVASTNEVYFDYDGNGFAEKMGWATSDDGMLVLDRNNDGIINDGTELFGDQTILKNGRKAANGFQALADLDNNADGKIDASDAAYSQLRIWQDADEDGYSLASELFTLEELGIKSINVTSTASNVTDQNGNTQTLTGSFEKTDGTIGQIANYNLRRDTMDTVAEEWPDIPEDIAALPYLEGFGNVHDLQSAMAMDASGQLKALVEQFVAEADPSIRKNLMEQILFKWTGSDGITMSRGGMDGRRLAVLEKFIGENFIGQFGSNPNWIAEPLLEQAYQNLLETSYCQLTVKSHLQDLYGKITYTWGGG